MTAALVANYWADGEFPDGTSTTIDLATTVSFLADFRNAGTASLEQLNAASVQLASGGMVTYDVQGTRAFAALCRMMTRNTVSPSGEADQRTTWDMPGHLSILGNGVLAPPNDVQGASPVIETIAFNWSHDEYDQTAWTTASSMSSVADAKAGQVNEWGTASPYGPWPWSDDWAESNALGADIIGPSDGTVTNVSNPNAPNQHHYYRRVIANSTTGAHRMAVGADNYIEVYADGNLIGTCGDWRHITWLDLDLTPGFHEIAIHLVNYPATIANPCGYSWALYSEDGTFVARSDASLTVCLEYQADPPGMSVGTVFRVALKPYVTNGEQWAIDVTNAFTFDDVYDSNGVPWDTLTNITAEVGSSILDLALKIMASYADIVIDPSSWAISAYVFDTFTPSSGVEFEAGRNITSLTHKTEDAPATGIWVRSDGLGWTKYGTGPRWQKVELGSEVASVDVAGISAQILARLGVTRREITLTYVPDADASPSEVPWVNTDFVAGCLATAPDLDGSPTSERVLSLGCAIGEGAETLQVTVTLSDRIEELNERIITELKG